MILALLLLVPNPVAEAEALASAALHSSAARPAEALSQARRALALTEEFDPVAFVKAGRKGEVVEDEYLAARIEYRRHRAKLFEAAGAALEASGNRTAALRYLRRAVLLDPAATTSRVRLARGLNGSGRPQEALGILLGGGPDLAPDALEVAGQAAEATGLASLQAELDRVRLLALPAERRPQLREGPLRLPDRARLSTGEPARLDREGLTLIYVADEVCRGCSADLLELRSLAPPTLRLWLLAAAPDRDQALRAVVASYRHRWPFLTSAGSAAELGWPGPCVVAVARHGFVAAIVRAPFATSLPPVIQALQRHDVTEPVPRSSWNRQPVPRSVPAALAGLLPSGLAIGEGEPVPAAFAEAVAAFEGKRYRDALRLLEVVASSDEAWLLPPEARFNRALCLAALGRREEARRLLLRLGDSRVQDQVDRALEAVASTGR